MAIELEEEFQVAAPVERVWRFLMTPENVAACMPGASLVETLDERNFVGNIKLKVGAVTANYQGRISFTEVDEAGRSVQMSVEAKEKGGGTVKGTVSNRMDALADGGTRVVCEAHVELTGRIMQVGRGMIQGVSQQLFKKFVANARERLEAEESAPAADPGGDTAAVAPVTAVAPAEADDSIAVVPLLFQTLWAWLKGLFGRSGGR